MNSETCTARQLVFATFASVFLQLAGQLYSQEASQQGLASDIGKLIKTAYESSSQAKTEQDFTNTVELCDQALEADVSDSQKKYLQQLKAWALVSRAKSYSEISGEKGWKRAIEDCDLAISNDPASWKAYVHRAKRYMQAGDYSRAIKDLGVAIRRKPQESSLWFNRAELLYAEGDYEIAVTDYTEALKLDSNDVQAFSGRGHCYFRLQKPELALADYDEVIKRTQKNAVAYLNRADVHLKMQRFKLAGEDYRDALIRDQTLAQAYRGVAWMYATSQDDKYHNPTVADRSVKRAIELDGRETSDNLVVLAAAQAAAGEYTMARDTLKRVREDKGLSTNTLEKLEFLENAKWFLAGTGKK